MSFISRWLGTAVGQFMGGQQPHLRKDLIVKYAAIFALCTSQWMERIGNWKSEKYYWREAGASNRENGGKTRPPKNCHTPCCSCICYSVHPCHLWGIRLWRSTGSRKKQWPDCRQPNTYILGIHYIEFGIRILNHDNTSNSSTTSGGPICPHLQVTNHTDPWHHCHIGLRCGFFLMLFSSTIIFHCLDQRARDTTCMESENSKHSASHLLLLGLSPLPPKLQHSGSAAE